MKFKMSLIAASLLSASAVAQPLTNFGQPIVIDPIDNDTELSDGTESFTLLDTAIFTALSYYVDEDRDGTISSGEFVFDVGSTIVAALEEPVPSLNGRQGFGTEWGLTADYIIYGEADVFDNPLVTSGIEDQIVAQVSSQFDCFAQISDPVAFTNCSIAQQAAIADALANPLWLGQGDGEYNNFGSINVDGSDLGLEVLAADIQGGVISIVKYDIDANDADNTSLGREFISSYAVNGSSVSGSGVNLTINASGVYATEDFFYTEGGQDFAELFDNGANWQAQLLTDVATAGQFGELSVPGTLKFDSGTTDLAFDDVEDVRFVDTALDTTYNVDGVDLSDFGQSVNQIVQIARDCPFSAFNNCRGQNNTSVPRIATQQWTDTINIIRANNRDENGRRNQVLARGTALNGGFRQQIPEPSILAIFGGALLAFAGIGRRRRS